MFTATITGTIKRVIADNGKDGKDAMMSVVVETAKRFRKEDEIPYNYPVVKVWGHDAAYLRDYGGKGHPAMFFDCELDVYKKDEGDERISFRAGKVEILGKKYTEALVEAGVVSESGEFDGDEDGGKKKKKKKSEKDDRKGGKSRSERRKGKGRDDEDEDEDDDDDEDEAPRKKKSAKKDEKKKPAKKSGGKSSKKKDYDDDDDDEDYDEDDYDDEDDDDDYFDDDED